MANPRFAWGIDIGNRALKAVKLVRTPEGLRVDDFEIIEHDTVLSNAGDNREHLVQSALANFVQRHPMKKGTVAVGVSGQSSFARFIKLPPVEEKKIPEIVRFEAIQQIPFPLDDVEWSYQLFRAPDSPDVEVGIFAMRKELVNRFIKDFTDFDMNVQVVQMNPLAVYNGMYNDNRFDGTTMVIDMGAENTDLIIADNDTIWMRSIPIGGNNFTQTLEKAFKLPFAKAEELKRNSATSKYARQIFQAMRPIFADLVAEIQRSMGFYASVHRDSRIKKIIALGGTFKLPGLQKYLQQNLQLDVEGLDSMGAAGPTDGKLAAHFNENLRASAVAYGLAVQAMGDAKITSSLLPTHIRRAKLWKEKTKWFGAAAALFVVGTTIAGARYFSQNLTFQQGEGFRQSINKVKSEATAKDHDWDDISSKGGDDRQKIINVRALTAYRTLWRDMLFDLQGALPAVDPKVADGLRTGNVDEIKSVKRDERKVILIDSIASQFYPDLNTVLTNPDFSHYALEQPIADSIGGGGPGNPSDTGTPPGDAGTTPAAAGAAATGSNRGGAGTRGFVVTIHCICPHQKALEIVDGEFVKNLMNIWPDAKRQHMEYGVAKAMMLSGNQIKDDATRMTKLKTDFDQTIRAKQLSDAQAAARAARDAATTGTPAPAGTGTGTTPPSGMFSGDANNPGGTGQPAINENDAYNDRVTGEDVRNDWELKVIFAIQLDPPAYTPPPPGQPAAGQAAPGQPAPGQPASGQPAPDQPAPGQPAPDAAATPATKPE